MPDHSSPHATRSSPAAATTGRLKRALSPCVYISLQCPVCGDLRQALAELPSSPTVCCPQCGTSCSFVALGRGATRRRLPFFEVPRPNARLLCRRDEIPPDDPPSLSPSG